MFFLRLYLRQDSSLRGDSVRVGELEKEILPELLRILNGPSKFGTQNSDWLKSIT